MLKQEKHKAPAKFLVKSIGRWLLTKTCFQGKPTYPHASLRQGLLVNAAF